MLFVAIDPPVRLMLVVPATAVAVPPQLLVNPLGVATTSPVGSVSVTATPACATVLAAGLVIVIVKLVVPFRAIAAAPKAFAIVGGAITVKFVVVLADTPVPPFVDVIAPPPETVLL